MRPGRRTLLHVRLSVGLGFTLLGNQALLISDFLRGRLVVGDHRRYRERRPNQSHHRAQEAHQLYWRGFTQSGEGTEQAGHDKDKKRRIEHAVLRETKRRPAMPDAVPQHEYSANGE